MHKLYKSAWLRAKGKEKQCDWWVEIQMSQWNHSAQSCCVTQGYYPVHPMGAMCCPGVYQVCNNLLLPVSSSSIYRCCTSLEHLIWYMLKYAPNYTSTRIQVHVKKKIGLPDFHFHNPKCRADSLHIFSPTSASSIQAKTLGVSPK